MPAQVCANPLMSTLSSPVKIEGHISQPRSWFNQLPEPFGAEWALVLREGSLRTELNALLRTFCLDEETMWSMCHWAAAWPRQSPPSVYKSYVPIAPLSDASAPAVATTVDAASCAPLRHTRTRAASACVLAGIAILVCLATGNLSQRPEERGAMQRQPPLDAKDSQAESPQRDTKAGDLQQKITAAPLPAQPLQAIRPHPDVRKAKHAGRHTIHHPTARPLGASKHPAATASHNTTHRTMAQSSRAGGYSLFAPAKRGVDEYAPVTISEDTRLRDALRAPRVALPGRLPATEWMSHMWQRRVTEIPSEFSKQ